MCNKTENCHLDTKVVIIQKEKKSKKHNKRKKNQERGVGGMKNMQITKQKLFKVTKCRKMQKKKVSESPLCQLSHLSFSHCLALALLFK